MLQNLAEQCKSLTPQANLFWLKVWHCSLCSPKTLELRQLRLHCHSWRFDPAFICLSPDCHISINRLPYKKESDIWSYVYKCKDRIPWPPPQHAAVGGMLDVWTGWLGKACAVAGLKAGDIFNRCRKRVSNKMLTIMNNKRQPLWNTKSNLSVVAFTAECRHLKCTLPSISLSLSVCHNLKYVSTTDVA